MPWPSETNHDTAIFDLLDAERTRQSTGLQLIASENFTSPDVMAATGSVLTNKYSEATRASVITVATRLLTRLKHWQLSE